MLRRGGQSAEWQRRGEIARVHFPCSQPVPNVSATPELLRIFFFRLRFSCRIYLLLHFVGYSQFTTATLPELSFRSEPTNARGNLVCHNRTLFTHSPEYLKCVSKRNEKPLRRKHQNWKIENNFDIWTLNVEFVENDCIDSKMLNYYVRAQSYSISDDDNIEIQ